MTPLLEGQIKNQALTHGMSEDEVVEKVMLKKQAVNWRNVRIFSCRECYFSFRHNFHVRRRLECTVKS